MTRVAICCGCGAEFPAAPGTRPVCPACGAKNPFPRFKPPRRRSVRVPLPRTVRGRLGLAVALFLSVAAAVAVVARR